MTDAKLIRTKRRDEVSAPGPAPEPKAEEPAPDAAPRPAAEITGNPLLGEGEIRIRSLCCNRKMKADSRKFASATRCPHCGASPFRFQRA
ncbi:MAG: hypothetical protein IT463_03945 [Planctomycetes bacterium]|nr:hypothetical protein [Planctomycetota bacterium]